MRHRVAAHPQATRCSWMRTAIFGSGNHALDGSVLQQSLVAAFFAVRSRHRSEQRDCNQLKSFIRAGLRSTTGTHDFHVRHLRLAQSRLQEWNPTAARQLEEENGTAEEDRGAAGAGLGCVEGGVGKKVVGSRAEREAVRVVWEEAELSERRACGLIGMHRGSWRYQRRERNEAALRARLRELAAERRKGRKRCSRVMAQRG